MHNRLQERLATLRAGGGLRLAFFGDSISELGRLPRWFGGASCAQNHYGEVCRDLLLEHFPAATVSTCYFGRGGHNTYMGLGRLHEVIAAEPDIVVVAFGANDPSWRPLSVEQSAFALRCILEQLRDESQAAAIVMAASSGDPELPEHAGAPERVAAQETVCAELGVPFVDTLRELHWRAIAGDTRDRYFPSLGDCHPNDEGHALWAELLAETLAELA